MRLGLLFGALVAALIIGVLALQSPAPRAASAPVADFSAARAMVDVRQIARRPHPLGSTDHARVQELLVARMTALGLSPTLQSGALSPQAVARLDDYPDRDAALAAGVVNIVGRLPGRDPTQPAVMLMAHYDSVPGSPGAADDASGVAAVLEAVRAIRARGPAERDLIVLFTDAEELNLDGARVFFSEHPWRERVGAVVNLEARGGGGRAMMFETGPGNAQTVRLFGRAARRAEGGPTSNSLAVLIYRTMPNGTDFTIPAERGVAGVNLAFIGRADQYHSPASTPAALDQGSVQHVGAQALEAADALLRTPALPRATHDSVYSDVFGLVMIAYAPGTGWIVLLAGLSLSAFAFWGARHVTGLSYADAGRGLLGGLWSLALAVALLEGVRALSGQAVSSETYYALLRRLPWMEAASALTLVAVALAAVLGPVRLGRFVQAGAVVVAVAVSTLLAGFNPVVVGAGVFALGLGFLPSTGARSTWGGWIGLLVLVGLLAGLAQAAAPAAALLFAWPLLLGGLAAAAAAVIGPRLDGWRPLVPAALTTALGGAWLIALAHPAWLGIGIGLPSAMAIIGLLILALARPLADALPTRALRVAIAAVLVLGCGFGVAAQVVEPAAAAQVG